MATIHPLTQDACVLAVDASKRISFRRGALEMLLDPPEGRRVERVPLSYGRDDESGELRLSKTGRTLEARLYDPPRLFLVAAAKARAFLRGELSTLTLFEATDDAAGTTHAGARVADARAPAATPPLAAPAMNAAASFADVQREVHACPGGLTCRPGKGVRYPAATKGRLVEERADVLFVAWNPRPDDCAHDAMPAFDDWRREGDAVLAAATPATRALAALLPEGRRLDDGRTAMTWLWRWPTRFRTATGDSRFYADRCIANHLWRELDVLRPRLLLAVDSDAAAWWREQAEARGLEVRVPPEGVRSAETVGWVAPSGAWGWPMGLVLVGDAADGARGHRDLTLKWARAAGARVLGETA
jgi:hypothetical protein